MDIKINTKIREKYHEGFKRNTSKINEIVVHQTGGGNNTNALLRWMFNSGRKGYSKGIALFHYVIDIDGSVTEVIDPDNWVYHSSSGRHDKKTIGIEIMCSDRNNEKEPNSKQYKALFKLFVYLRESYPITKIVGHGYNKRKYSNADKNCPGDFNWFNIEKFLVGNGYSFDYEDECFFDIEV
jgi:N-acetyl-anhydromuramyl-L-alanine amidase AmpD